MSLAYRPEIDGLRAIAVLAVVLYHAGLGGAGYVGVDVFFVISGYLITALLLREHADTGRIDLLAFYARRVRRIFPAAVVVVLAVLAVSGLLLPADAFRDVARSAGASAVFFANVWFQAATDGYFAPRAEEMPLLHLWSLAVEEQFYFLWPAALGLLLRTRAAGRWIAALALGSLLLAEVLLRSDPASAFYEMPPRFWELAAGGLIAALPARALPRGVATAGLGVTLAACVVPAAYFPGLGALPAVAGSAAVIATLHGGTAHPWLRWAPLRFVGLVSFSLYLWHWPLLALYRATSIGATSVGMRSALCAVAFVLAIASWRYVEQPFRRMRLPSGRTVATGAAASLMVAGGASAFAFVPAATVVETNLDLSTPPLAVIAHDDRQRGYLACHYFAAGGPLGTFPKPHCGSPHARYAVWGDSFGVSWQPFAWQLAAQAKQPATAFHFDHCPALVGFVPVNGLARNLRCRDYNDGVVAAVQGMDTLVIATRWRDWLHQPGAVDALARTLAQLRSVRRVLLVGPTPELPELAPRCVAAHREADCAVARADYEAQAAPLRAILEQAARPYANVEILRPERFLCDAGTCPVMRDGVVLYLDDHHLTATAAAAYALAWGAEREGAAGRTGK